VAQNNQEGSPISDIKFQDPGTSTSNRTREHYASKNEGKGASLQINLLSCEIILYHRSRSSRPVPTSSRKARAIPLQSRKIPHLYYTYRLQTTRFQAKNLLRTCSYECCYSGINNMASDNDWAFLHEDMFQWIRTGQRIDNGYCTHVIE